MYASFVFALLGVLAIAGVPLAAAHEHVHILDDKGELTVGWRTEPAYAGEKNGLDLGVTLENATGAKVPVTNMLGNLTVTYEIAGKTFTPPDLRAQFGRAGWYTAEITPTREGVYTIHIVGSIGGEAFDVRIQPHAVESLSDTMFPETDLTSEEATAKISALEAQVDALQKGTVTPATTEATKADAPGLGAAAVVLALAAAVALLQRRK